jgi:mannan endo-1,4-beta-mannosidase
MPLKEPIFRHPDLDFASIHIYQEKTIDDPKDTVAPAIAVGDIVRDALAEMPDKRPFLDTEHGPIHAFKDKHITLPEPFDDEYFKHMQWAHFASGGAGGGMRWPNRRPHVLTEGMRRAQRSLSKFLPLIHWPALARINLNREVKVLGPALAAFACGDRHQAIVWLLRTDTLGPGGMLDKATPPIAPTLRIPGLATGRYAVTAWNTKAARPLTTFSADSADGRMIVQVPSLDTDVALAIQPA